MLAMHTDLVTTHFGGGAGVGAGTIIVGGSVVGGSVELG